MNYGELLPTPNLTIKQNGLKQLSLFVESTPQGRASARPKHPDLQRIMKIKNMGKLYKRTVCNVCGKSIYKKRESYMCPRCGIEIKKSVNQPEDTVNLIKLIEVVKPRDA